MNTWNQLISIFTTRIEEKRLMYELHNSWLFRFGIITRLLFIILCIPLLQKIWFIQFITTSLQPISFNPWTAHLVSGGEGMAFPYGYTMYLAYLPLTALGLGIDQLLDISYFSKIGFGLTSLFFDYGILISIALLARKYSTKLLLVAYWCSPIVLYIFYWHGQLDALPICLLVWGIVQLQRERSRIAGLLFGMAISAKLSMLAAIPFIIIYLYRNRRLRKQLRFLLSTTLITVSISVLPFLKSSSFVSMVLQTPETERIFNVFMPYGGDLKLFLLPLAYILTLYLVWRLERITLDLFLMTVGLGFFAFLLLLPPAPGWFLWVIPFLVLYQLRYQDEYLITTLPFFSLYIIYNLMYSTGADIHLIDQTTSEPFANYIGLNNIKLKSVLFTGLQATGLLICVRMYLFGISRNNYYRGFKRKLGIGIAGNIANDENKSIVSIEKIFGSDAISFLNLADYDKWDKHHPMRSSKNLLNPNSYNLSRLSGDVFTLAEGKPIWQTKFSEKKNKHLRKINSNDLILVTGLHSLYIKRLRDRMDLKIFVEVDETLKNYFNPKLDNSTYQLIDWTSDKERTQYDKFVSTQIKFADLIFRLSPINSLSLKDGIKNKRLPKLKLEVEMVNGFFHEELVHSLIGLCGMHVDVQQSSLLENVFLSIEGDITSEDIEQIANLLIPNLEDLAIGHPEWETGYKGLMQLITMVHISDLLHRGRVDNYA